MLLVQRVMMRENLDLPGHTGELRVEGSSRRGITACLSIFHNDLYPKSR